MSHFRSSKTRLDAKLVDGHLSWQQESYDRWVRNKREFDNLRGYIEENPAKARLAARAELYPWSSAGVETSLDAARTSACATCEVCAYVASWPGSPGVLIMAPWAVRFFISMNSPRFSNHVTNI